MEKLITQAEAATLRAGLPAHVIICRQPSGWTNASLMLWPAQQLGELQSWHPELQMIVASDAHRSHFASKVLRAFAARHALYMVLPA